MYPKDQASQLKHAFWTSFGQYMAPIASAEGLKVNWVNYKTGIKHVYFRMKAENKSAVIAIEITHPDNGIQELFFEQFYELRNILHGCIKEDWLWELHTADEYGKTISRIYKEISAVSVYETGDWPKLIGFLKPRIIALDEFWTDARFSFDALK